MRDSDRSLVCAIRGPITLITLGALFALNNFTPYGFQQTWPVLLIVFGLLSLLRRGVETAPPASPDFYPRPAPPYTYTPPPPADAANYRQSQYPDAAAPSGPAKGGFGSTGARPGETGENQGGSV